MDVFQDRRNEVVSLTAEVHRCMESIDVIALMFASLAGLQEVVSDPLVAAQIQAVNYYFIQGVCSLVST